MLASVRPRDLSMLPADEREREHERKEVWVAQNPGKCERRDGLRAQVGGSALHRVHSFSIALVRKDV